VVVGAANKASLTISSWVGGKLASVFALYRGCIVDIRLLQYLYPKNRFRKTNFRMGCRVYEMPYEKSFS